jgi:hypothetical protein
MLKHRLTVKSHRPIQWCLAIILMSMLLAITTWFALDRSLWSLIDSNFRTSRDFQHIQSVNTELEAENSRLRDQVMMMERTAGIDRETMTLLQNEIKVIQNEIYQLKGELEFYQGVMDATRSGKGLNIQGIRIENLARPRSYSLKLVLTHVAKSVKVAEGRIDIVFEGMRNATSAQLQLEEISLDEALDLNFKFRNFSRFESRLELPEGFVPDRIIVQLHPKDKKLTVIKSIFDWPETAGLEI